MTDRARLVLDDCKLVLELLENETDLRRWRIHWVAAVALIRAVGHVLDKVDGNAPAVKAAARSAYKRWTSTAPEDEIFREFIERERNTILKEYEFNLHPNQEVEVVVPVNLRRVADSEIIRGGAVFPLSENVYRPLLEGFRQGDDARDVLSDAIEWWDGELAAIEDALHGPKR
jgi:hypothetical protein